MNKVTEQRLEMVRELADKPTAYADYFTDWAGNDEGNRMLQCAKRLFMIDVKGNEQVIRDALWSFQQSVMDASGIDDDDALDALEALREGYRQSAWEAVA